MDNISVAFIIIKPDAIERNLVGRIISRFEDTHLRVMAIQERHKTIEWAQQHYSEHANNEYFEALTKFMVMRPIISFNVAGLHAIRRCRLLVGPTKSWEAPAGTIRGDFGTCPAMYNCVHVSDSEEAAHRERVLFYAMETTVVKTPDEE